MSTLAFSKAVNSDPHLNFVRKECDSSLALLICSRPYAELLLLGNFEALLNKIGFLWLCFLCYQKVLRERLWFIPILITFSYNLGRNERVLDLFQYTSKSTDKHIVRISMKLSSLSVAQCVLHLLSSSTYGFLVILTTDVQSNCKTSLFNL